MAQPKQTDSRKKFLLWGATILSCLPLLKLIPVQKRQKAQPSNETVKMFSQDGKLVEIDKRFVVFSGKKISNEELQKWIKK